MPDTGGCWRAAAAVVVLLAAGCEGRLVSRQAEMRLGAESARVIERRYPVCEDAELQWLVERLGRQVAQHCGRPDVDFTFRVLDVRDVNALSVPGYVYVNRGLINMVNADPQELAGVIAHEIAHTTERHVAKQMERIYGASFLLQVFSSGRATIDTVAEVAVNLALSGNSRQDERAADAQALRFMSRAGYDPEGLVRFFERLKKQTGDSQGPIRYFASHPPTADRIARARELIRVEGLAAGGRE
ncbi:MAG: M48 family metalloprotease [Armatimonadetes bacterium]|nr:M48 family metalloprotease [Armatimonadota bacterium]